MTTTPALRPTTTTAAISSDPTPTLGPRTLRRAATALLLGGPLSFVFHVLWRIGHGPTIVNEHGVVLGLTNDQWSYLGGFWAVLVSVGVVAVCRLHRGRLASVAATLTVTGLALGAAASWLWPLYSLGALLQYAGMLALGVMLLSGRLLPRYAGTLMLLAVALFLPLPLAPEVPYAPVSTGLPFTVEVQDLIMLAAAAAWTALGWALLSRGGRHAVR